MDDNTKPTFDDLAHAFRRGVEEVQGLRRDPEPEANELLQAAYDLGKREEAARPYWVEPR